MAELKDSGSRREFESGAVRDIQEGKGRCDLLPLDIVAPLMDARWAAETLYSISEYVMSGNDFYLFSAIRSFCEGIDWTIPEALLEVSKHYEDGAVKYGERNWEKGIPLHCYIDSGVRHLLKFCRGDQDEPHDRAFVWNMLGAIWTHKWRADLCDLPGHKTKTEEELHKVYQRINEIDNKLACKQHSSNDHKSTEHEHSLAEFAYSNNYNTNRTVTAHNTTETLNTLS